MTFTLTGPLISAFALGVLSSAGVWLLIKLWFFAAREQTGAIVLAVLFTAIGVAMWLTLFQAAFA